MQARCQKKYRRAEVMLRAAMCLILICLQSGNSNVFVEINVLNHVQKLDAFL